jgi:transcriptional regulator with XRE-family HTH domain
MSKPDPADFDEAAFRKKLSTQISRIRTSRGYSMDRLTDEAGLSRGTLSKIESGRTSPQVVTLAKIAKTLGIPLRKLLDF